jgi:uncharacterized damage-inducible protein DinB
MNVADLRSLYDYNSWANHRVFEYCAVLTPEQFARDLGSSFPSVRDTLVHILSAEWIWLERLHGVSPAAFIAPTELKTVSHVVERWSGIERGLHDYVNSLEETGLGRVLEYKNTAGTPYASPVWQVLQHVVNHSTYHRGQVTTMLRQLGAKAVSTDLIAFYREHAKPATA